MKFHEISFHVKFHDHRGSSASSRRPAACMPSEQSSTETYYNSLVAYATFAPIELSSTFHYPHGVP